MLQSRNDSSSARVNPMALLLPDRRGPFRFPGDAGEDAARGSDVRPRAHQHRAVCGAAPSGEDRPRLRAEPAATGAEVVDAHHEFVVGEAVPTGEREPRRALAGSDLFERISEAESLRAQQSMTIVSRLQSAGATRDALRRLLEEREAVEREITLGAGPNNARHYYLRVSSVADSAHGEVYGIVAVFTDITRHRELQRT